MVDLVSIINTILLKISTSGLSQITLVYGILSIIFGLIVIWKPNIIAYLIGLYLILVGIGILIGVAMI